MSRRRPSRARRRRGLLWGLGAVALTVAVVGAWLWQRPSLAPGEPGFRDAALDEVSGMVASRRLADTFWVHNDSGGSATLYAVHADGRLRGAWPVVGAEANDWEDITTDDAGGLWIADTGNNNNRRRDLRLYRAVEPLPRPGAQPMQLEVDRVVPFRYAEQTGFPPDRPDFDAEAIFWAPHPQTGAGTVYLLTKHRSGDLATDLYRFDDLSGAAEVTPTRVGTGEVGGDPDNYGGMVTAADASPDGQRLAVLTYHALLLYARPARDDDRYLQRLHARIPLDQAVFDQCEAVAWDGDDLIIANEQRRLFRVPNVWAQPPARLPAD